MEWKRYSAEFKREAVKSDQQQELVRLRRELKRVTTERDILKKAVGYFAQEPS